MVLHEGQRLLCTVPVVLVLVMRGVFRKYESSEDNRLPDISMLIFLVLLKQHGLSKDD